MNSEYESVEQLLSELEASDHELHDLPSGLWERIEAEALDAPTASRFSARAMPVLAIAAATVVVAGLIGILLSRSTDQADVLASAQLSYDAERFDPLGANADALVVLVNDGGEQVIQIDQATLPNTTSDNEDLELWLIEPDANGEVSDLVSLGLIDPANPGEFRLPDGVDPDVFFVVDISVEPRDGVETHSGRSILRGPLDDA